MLLPHGMDGNGPEHSSARLERFLQLSDDSIKLQENYLYENGNLKSQINNTNLQVACPTTAANYFHLLRRQMRREFRKPLIVMTSKKLLRFKQACSDLKAFDQGGRYLWVIPDDLEDTSKVDHVVLCSGQVYYDALDGRKKRNLDNTAIIRLE